MLWLEDARTFLATSTVAEEENLKKEGLGVVHKA
jgi:hypothetical protein